MKKYILIFAAMLMFASCTRKVSDPGKNEPYSEVVGYERLAELIGAQNAFDHFDRAGMTEPASSTDPMARGGKKVKGGAQATVLFATLTLNVVAGEITYSTVPDADWGGCTKFIDTTSNDGALGIWDCGRYWNRLYETVPPEVVCHDSATAGYFLRAFTSNSTTGVVNLSDWVG